MRSRVAVPALAALCLAGCGGTGEVPADDPLWIALIRTDGSMTPIARHHGGIWDRPWPDPFRPILRIDSAGLVQPHLASRWPVGHEPWALPVDLLEPGQLRLTAPLEWFLYSRSERGVPLTLTELRLAPAQCLHEWVLDTDRAGQPRVAPGSHRELAGVAFNRSVEVVAEEDIPGLDAMREDLGFVDETGVRGTRYTWLGLYRTGSRDTIVGIVHAVGYESEWFDVVEIEGEVARVVVTASGGMC